MTETSPKYGRDIAEIAEKSDAQTDLIANAKGTAYLNCGEPRKSLITILDPENGENKWASSVAIVQKISICICARGIFKSFWGARIFVK